MPPLWSGSWVVHASGVLVFSIVLLAAIGLTQYRRHSKKIAGRHVVVTGGSQGIGLWAAVRAAELGANVTLIARNLEQLKKAQEIVISYCQSAATQHVRIASIDVCSDEATLAAQLDQVEADGGPIYMLINCAGTAVCGTVEDTSVKTARHLMDVNFFGTFGPTRHVLAGMQRRQQGGIVVLTSSLAGVVGVYGMGAYCAAKFALRGFAESLALENAHRDISVTVALPGDTDTPGFAVENETKPRITKLMSESGGLVHPRAMGKQIVEDALCGHFFSVYDHTAFLVATMCAGLSPYGGFLQTLLGMCLLGPLKLYSFFLGRSFRSLVRKESAVDAANAKKD